VALNTTKQTYLWVIRVLIDQGKIPASANKQKKDYTISLMAFYK
jgi:hypothetical protein